MTNSRLLDALIGFVVVSVCSFLGVLTVEGGDYNLADNWLRHVIYGLGSATFFAIIFPYFARRRSRHEKQQR